MPLAKLHLFGCPSSVAFDDRLQPSIHLCMLAAKTLADARGVIVLVATDDTEHEHVLAAFVCTLVLRECAPEVNDGRSYE